jgi:hypothetical protein
MDHYTIEIRDGRSVPLVQAIVAAPNPAEALVLAAMNADATEWVFLRELTGEEISRLLGETP